MNRCVRQVEIHLICLVLSSVPFQSAETQGNEHNIFVEIHTHVRRPSFNFIEQCLPSHPMPPGPAHPLFLFWSADAFDSSARRFTCTGQHPCATAVPNNAGDVRTREKITCVAGVGPMVDIYTLPGIVSFSLSFV